MSEGPISAEQVKELLALAWSLIDDPLWKARQEFEDSINALIRPLFESAVASAQAEMRERCAEVIANEIRLREMDHDAGGHAMCHLRPIDELEQDIRALPLSPASDAWLWRVVDATMYLMLHRSHGEPLPTYEYILAEAAKEKP